MSTSIVPTTGGLGRSDTGSHVPSSQSSYPASHPSSSAAISIVPTTGRQGERSASAGVPGAVAVGLVLTVVVLVLVVAIVLAAVCLVCRRRKKYDPTCNVSYEVPPDVYVGEFTKHWHTVYY